jgi:flagellar biosynthesis/type III secretory pathway protein FliH
VPAAAPARRIPAEIYAARREAREILRVAAGEAEEIVRRARGEAARIRGEAEAEGLRAGLGRAAAEVARASSERASALAACAPRVLEIAVTLAGRVLGREVVPGDDALRAARVALAELSAEGRAVLRASPADARDLRAAGGALGHLAGQLHVVEDPSLGTGEVIVEAGGSRVDGRFAAQLAVLARALREEGP